MKIIILLIIPLLLQSCFSYKTLDNDTSKMEAGKTYKIERNHKYLKVVFNATKDSAILVSKNFEEQQIPIQDITSIKKRKFSIIKTLLLPLGIITAVIGLFVLNYKGPSTGGISTY